MPPLPTPAYRLDLWTAPAPAGGTRVGILVEPGTVPAAVHVQRARFLESGRSALTCDVLPDWPHVAALAPQAGILRLTRFVPTGPDAFTSVVEEWRITKRVRVVRGGVGLYAVTAVPLEDDLLDCDQFRETTGGGLAVHRFGATERTPAEVLTDLRTRLHALGYTWIDVGTVTPTAKVTFALERTATPRAIITALIEALAAIGVDAEFQCPLASDLSEYRLELVTRVAGSLPPLVVSTAAEAFDLQAEEDALEQANVLVPFTPDGGDLRELQLEIAAIDAGTGWVTLQGIGGIPAQVIAADDQWNGHRLFRELTGRSFAITDTTLAPPRVRIATADLASGLAVGERVSFRASEDQAGTRRAFGTPARYSPFEVQSTLTGPPRIRTDDLYDASAVIAAADQYRDWTAERSTLVAALPTGAFNAVTGVLDLGSAPSAAPQAGDWVWFPQGLDFPPGTVQAYNGTTHELTLVPRYPGTQFAAGSAALAGARCYRPVGTPMWITASLVANSELTVDAFTGGTPAAGDVLEVRQAHQGVRVVEVADPVAVAATRRKVASLDVACTGATNRVPNADLAAWAGGSGDPPDGWSIGSVVGTVTRARVTDALLTRYGGKAWSLDFAAGASAEVYSPRIPIHPVPGMQQVAAALALKCTRFTGSVPLHVTLYRVAADGTRTAIGDPVTLYPLDTTVSAADEFKAAPDQWYDAVLTDKLLEDWTDESLQLGLRRPAGGSNPACTVVLDLAMLVQRAGLPTAEDGGVRYVVGSDALPMLVAANLALQDRARPLVRFDGRLLDLFRLDGAHYAAWELVLGRDVQLTLAPLAETRTVRLLGVTERLEDPRSVQVTLDRVRPDVGRLMARRLRPPAPTPAPVTEATRPKQRATLTVKAMYDDDTYTIQWSGGPTVELAINGGAPAAPPASPITVARSASTGANKVYVFTARSEIPGDEKTVTVIVERKPAAPPAATPAITGVSVTNAITPCDGGGGFDLGISVSNMPGTETYTWSAQVLSGWALGQTSDGGSGVAPGSFPVAVSLDLCSGAQVAIHVETTIGGETYDYDTVVTL